MLSNAYSDDTFVEMLFHKAHIGGVWRAVVALKVYIQAAPLSESFQTNFALVQFIATMYIQLF